MPTYLYKCKECKHTVEAERKVEQRDETPECQCGFETVRVYAVPAIKFNGPGFYSTDNR